MQEISKKEYDIINYLEKEVQDYLSNDKVIEGLSSLVKKLVLSLNEVDQVYRDSLFSYWSGIEQAYSVMCSDMRSKPNQEEAKIIAEESNNIKNLCQKLVQVYSIPSEDPLSWPYPDGV
jgi:vacuolar-type H+-ATPase subunit H